MTSPRDRFKDETTLWEDGYSPRAMIGFWILLVITLIVVLVCDLSFQTAAWPWLLPLFLIPAAMLSSRQAYCYYFIRYQLTDQRLITRAGCLVQVTDRVELADVGDVFVKRSPLQSFLNYGTIEIETTDRSHPVLALPGVRNAREVADRIRGALQKASRALLLDDVTEEFDEPVVVHLKSELAALDHRKPAIAWLTSIVAECCLRFPQAIPQTFDVAMLGTCCEEAVHLVNQGDVEAGDDWARTCSLQAVTLVLVGLAQTIPRSNNALLLVTDVCETLLSDDKIQLRINWSQKGKDKLYRLLVESDDLHDESVYQFLDAHCQR
jgi:membrane protein YdbS with pleckstrin-like domain